VRLPRQVWAWLADRPHQFGGIRLLQCALGLMLLIRVGTEAPFLGYLWGPHGLGWGSTRPVLGPTLGGLVDQLFATDLGTLAVLVVLAASALGLVLGRLTQLSTALAFIAFTLLDQRLPELVDRGDTAARLALLYLLVVLPWGSTVPRGSLLVWVHNLGVAAIAIQAMLIYATAGLMKIGGPEWMEGTALYYISQVESLSSPAMRELVKQPFVTAAGTYFTVVYEVLFPIAMLTRLRRIWIGLGVAFHLAIAVSLGLVTFSTVMIGLDLFFLTDAECGGLFALVRQAPLRLWKKIRVAG
jgi:hypothetical protein